MQITPLPQPINHNHSVLSQNQNIQPSHLTIKPIPKHQSTSLNNLSVNHQSKQQIKSQQNHHHDVHSINIRDSKIIQELCLSNAKKIKGKKATSFCSSKTARNSKTNQQFDFVTNQAKTKQHQIEKTPKKYKHKQFEIIESPDEDKVATSQLLNQNLSQQFQGKIIDKKDKVNDVKFEEKVEGWILKTALKESQIKKRMNQNSKIQKLILLSELKQNEDTNSNQNQDSPRIRNRKRNFSEVLTNKFLKNLELKYSKHIESKIICQSLSKIQSNFAEEDPLIKQDPNLIIKSSRVYKNKEDDKKQKKKTPLTFNTVMPNLEQSFKSINKTQKKPIKKTQKAYLNSRINHDSLIPRPESRCKKTAHMDRKKSKESIGNESHEKFNDEKLDKLGRNITIDHSQLQKMKEQTQQEVKIKKRQANLNHSSASKLLNMQTNVLTQKNKKQEPKNVQWKNQNKKSKLKYLHNLQSAHLTSLYPMSKDIEQASKIFRPQNNTKTNSQSQSLIQKGIKTKQEKHKIIPWEVRICERGGQNFHNLRNLIKKEHRESVYLCSQISERCKR